MTNVKQGNTVRANGKIFGVHERSVRRYRDEVEALLVAHGFRPPGAARAIRSLEDLKTYLENSEDQLVIVDGTEVERSSPKLWNDQVKAYSGKCHGHRVKGTTVSDRSRRPLWFEANPTHEGRTHDITMLRNQTGLLNALKDSGVFILGDRGYQGLHHDIGHRAVTPRKKTNNETEDDRYRRHIYNNGLSSTRIAVEHANGRMKWWRSMREWRRPAKSFDRGGKAIGVLASMF